MALVYFGLGSNLGQKKEFIERAVSEIEKQIGSIVALSAFYESAPWGFESANSFINACAAVETTLSPRTCLAAIATIENLLGRSKMDSDEYKDRVIDIDILFYDQLVIDDKDLKVPHPLLHHRLFVLDPLAQIAPKLMHPLLHKNIETLLDEIN